VAARRRAAAHRRRDGGKSRGQSDRQRCMTHEISCG
jgi:hypothetical protein